VDHHQPICIRQRQRPDQNGIHHGEDAQIRPETNRQREHGHGGEAGVLQQLAQGEAEVEHGEVGEVFSGQLAASHPGGVFYGFTDCLITEYG